MTPSARPRAAALLAAPLLAWAAGCPRGPATAPGHAAGGPVHVEVGGLVAVEAEHFAAQEADGVRRWHLTTVESEPLVAADGDGSHAATASAGAYLEILPDTRRSHDDPLLPQTNFSNIPGSMGVLHYRVHFDNPGRYYVWVRAHSTGSEDNGIHVGIDGTWPESGLKMQWCEGKGAWRWESMQRTEAQHCGEPHRIYLDVPTPGVHTVSFSMREDGFEFDRWIMTRERDFPRPQGPGPEAAPRR